MSISFFLVFSCRWPLPWIIHSANSLTQLRALGSEDVATLLTHINSVLGIPEVKSLTIFSSLQLSSLPLYIAGFHGIDTINSSLSYQSSTTGESKRKTHPPVYMGTTATLTLDEQPRCLRPYHSRKLQCGGLSSTDCQVFRFDQLLAGGD